MLKKKSPTKLPDHPATEKKRDKPLRHVWLGIFCLFFYNSTSCVYQFRRSEHLFYPSFALTKQSFASSNLRIPALFSGPSGMVFSSSCARSHIDLLTDFRWSGRWPYAKCLIVVVAITVLLFVII